MAKKAYYYHKLRKIPKKSGGFRTIAIPNGPLKRRLRVELPKLKVLAKRVCDPEIVHGFTENKSVVTNAKKHVGKKFTLIMDIEDFFDNTTKTKYRIAQQSLISPPYLPLPDFFYIKVNPAIENSELYSPQGYPTSPVIANISFSPVDTEIKKILPKEYVYTRYADDLAISGDSIDVLQRLRKKIPEIVELHGYKIKESKTRILFAKAGRRKICGVMVDEDGIYPSRKSKRKLRAALHQKKIRQAKGLEEWNKLREPNPNRTNITMAKRVYARHVVQKMFNRNSIEELSPSASPDKL